VVELKALFTAWVESVYHHQTHSETGQTPLARWNDGWQGLGHGPTMASTDALTEAFLWSEQRTVTKTATVSLHGNTYQVPAALAGRKVELVFSPFNLESIEVRHRGHSYGPAVPHVITRHTHPKARPETVEQTPAPATGIAYLHMVADAHQQQLIEEDRIGFHALYSAPDPASDASGLDQLPHASPDPEHSSAGQDPGHDPEQLSIDDFLTDLPETTTTDAIPGTVPGAQRQEVGR
jgi:putative transposase